MKLREGVTEARTEAQSAHLSIYCEKKKINNLVLKIDSSNVTFEEKERMTDEIKLDLNR